MADKDWTPTVAPSNESEFELMMTDLDTFLTKRGFTPPQRPMNAAFRIAKALARGSSIFPPKELAPSPSYQGDHLIAKAYRWYDEVYGEQVNMFPGHYFAASVVNAVWRVRLPKVWGRVLWFADRDLQNTGAAIATPDRPASANVLALIDDFPQGSATRLSDDGIRRFSMQFRKAFRGAEIFNKLTSHTLYDAAKNDYNSSVEAIVSTNAYANARWATAQTMEKMIKGLLASHGHSFPTDAKKGHDLVYLGLILKEKLLIHIPPVWLSQIQCPPNIRYGAIPTSLLEALTVHHVLLEALPYLTSKPRTT